MPINPLQLAEEVLIHIWEQRALLGVKAGLPVEEMEAMEGRTLGLAHPVFTLGLHELARGEAQAAQTGLRVMEFSGETPKAFYDVSEAETGKVQQMSATSPYLQLLPRALAAVSALPQSETRYDLRLLRAPALNFEALWLHTGEGAEDKVIPLRAFHGFAAMQAISYREAIDKLRRAAQNVNQQDDETGA